VTSRYPPVRPVVCTGQTGAALRNKILSHNKEFLFQPLEMFWIRDIKMILIQKPSILRRMRIYQFICAFLILPRLREIRRMDFRDLRKSP
jgi:hypothetical protein